MIFGPGSQRLKFAINAITEGLEFGSEISFVSSGGVEFSEEDQSDVFFEIEVDLWVILLESFDFDDEFFNEEGEGQFHLQRPFILSRHLHDVILLYFDYFLNDFGYFDYSGEEDELVQFSEELFDVFYLSFQIGIGGFCFSEIYEKNIHVYFDVFDEKSIFLFVSGQISVYGYS